MGRGSRSFFGLSLFLFSVLCANSTRELRDDNGADATAEAAGPDGPSRSQEEPRDPISEETEPEKLLRRGFVDVNYRGCAAAAQPAEPSRTPSP